MGRYYSIVNVDKREELSRPGGLKMAEWCYHGTFKVRALLNLLAGPWKGDRVFVLTYRANPEEEPYGKALAEVLRETGAENLRLYVDEHYRQVDPDEVDAEDHGYRYIYNHDLKVYIDLDHCPAARDDIAPLPLLLAMGFLGAGDGGDFDLITTEMEEMVGSWCDSVRSLEVRKERLEGVDYAEFRPDFTATEPGRFYLVVNADKREQFHSEDSKLTNWAYSKAGMVTYLHGMLAGPWKGDRVYVVAHDALSGWEFPENDGLCDTLAQSEEKTLFAYAAKHFKIPGGEDAPIEKAGEAIRYIYNHALKVYIDIAHCPQLKDHWTSTAPLPFLLAIGHRGDMKGDLGTGDNGFAHVGTWCATVRSLEVSKDPLPGVDYPEFRPDFLEKEYMEEWLREQKAALS